jgi:6-phosphogluconolactonase/glucosamine-6-phosphate isomerase/deaminase
MKLDTRVVSDMDALSRGTLEEVLHNLHDAIVQRGRFAIALSGGHTPAKIYALRARRENIVTKPPGSTFICFGERKDTCPQTIH